MGADNWAVCPKCRLIEQQKINKQLEDLRKKYGKINETLYVIKYNLFNKDVDVDKIRTFREDYEIGIIGENFSVEYNGFCEVCKLSKKLKIEEKINLKN